MEKAEILYFENESDESIGIVLRHIRAFGQSSYPDVCWILVGDKYIHVKDDFESINGLMSGYA